MAVLALGVSHRRASVELLERLSFTDDDLVKAYRRVEDLDAVDECVVLSTCNRVEVYATVASYHAGFQALKRLLAETRGIEPDELAEPLYSHYEDAAAEHLMGVAAGLDSMVLGEPQILSQVREAARRAEAEGEIGPALADLFRTAGRVGGRIRSETAVGAAPSAFVAAACALARRELGDLEGTRALVIGAGQMASLAVHHLRELGVGPVRILNRSVERARALAEKAGAEHGDLDGLAEGLAAADLVVSATGAGGVVVPIGAVEEAAAARAGRPLYVLDLAVPRDVDPAVGGLQGVTLLDVDDLKASLEPAAGEEDLARARSIVEEELQRIRLERQARRLAPLIRAVVERGEAVTRAEIQRHRAQLADLEPAEREAVEALAHGIVNKLLHDPIVRLKELATPASDGLYERAIAELLGIDPTERA